MVEDNYPTRASQSSVPKVVISGCSSGGKSSLIGELYQRGFEVKAEPGRQIVKEQQLIQGSALPTGNGAEFIALCVSRSAFFYHSIESESQPVFFDRSLIDAVSAYQALHQEIPQHYNNAVAYYRYHKTVFMAPPCEAFYENDSQRTHSFASAVEEYERLLISYPAFGYQCVHLPVTSVAQRADFVLETLAVASLKISP